MRDPYLIPGQPCEVLNKESMCLTTMYFKEVDSRGYNVFYKTKLISLNSNIPDVVGAHNFYDFYHPIGTEWDYAPAWVVCSTVDQDGVIRFWGTMDLTTDHHIGEWIEYSPDCDNEIQHFICPDKTRYEGDAWKTSLRMRPDWAK